jgi:DNA-binding CsgD family transcriptional regulator
VAEGAAHTDHQRARADLIRAQLAYVTGRGSDAAPLLMKAAERLEPIDAALSRATYLDALQAAWFAGRLALGCGVLDVTRAVQRSPKPQTRRLSDLLLDGLAAYFTDGYAAAVPILRRAVSAAGDGSDHVELRFLVGVAAAHIWDDESWDALSARHLELARSTGALTELPLALNSRANLLLFAGERVAAEAHMQEAQLITRATGDRLAADAAIPLLAFRGDQAAVSALIEATTGDVMRRGEGYWLSATDYAEAVLNNGIGNYQAALAPAQRAAEHPDLATSAWAAVELVEAAARSGMTDTAADALSRLSDMTSASGTDWALGVEARSRALLIVGAEADRLYREAIERLGRTLMRADLARAHLLYGEWLRRRRRRVDARTQLHIAHDMFDAMGMHGFAERARRELMATGETARKRSTAASGPQLTPQEEQIARLAAEGLTNLDIGARLFISAKTVQYHLSKVFTKLDISSRSELPQLLPN